MGSLLMLNKFSTLLKLFSEIVFSFEKFSGGLTAGMDYNRNYSQKQLFKFIFFPDS